MACLRIMIKGNKKMIKEKNIPFLLSCQIGGISTIGDTHKLAFIKTIPIDI
jgi:prolyl-tRNA editing enzyme YbaK/EbsC (Cys-tRNA(Pro) deacylase)